MDMELWTWSCGENRVLLLDTRGKQPSAQERGMFLCRSLTLSADRLLMGPVSWESCPGLIRMDHEGVRIPADKEDAAAFLAFLSAAGYGNYPAATDDLRILSPNEQEFACWQGTKMPEEERKKCLSLN